MKQRLGSKRLIVGVGALSALAGAFLLGSITLGGALAQGSDGADAGCGSSGYTSSVTVADREAGTNEAGEAQQLAPLAKVTSQQASATAAGQFPGGSVQKVQLENDNGSVVYHVEVSDASGSVHDVKVDAGNGAVLHVEAESADGADGGACD